MKLPVSRENAVRIACLVFLGLTVWQGLVRTPETASVLVPRSFYGSLVGDAEKLVYEKEVEHDRRAALGAALAVRLAEVRAGVVVPSAESLIDEASLMRALARARARQIEAEDDLLRAREKLARSKRLRDGGPIRLGCAAPRETLR